MEDKVFETFDEFYEAVWEDLKPTIPKEHYEIARKFMDEEREEARKRFEKGRNTLAAACSMAHAFSYMY